MTEPQTKFHGKVRVQIGETLIEINIFDDNQEKVYLEVQKAVAQFSRDINPATAAQRDIARAEQAAAARTASPAKPAPRPAPKPAPAKPAHIPGLDSPWCPACQTDSQIEARQFTDKDTGETMQRSKCKGCGRWIGKATPMVEELAY